MDLPARFFFLSPFGKDATPLPPMGEVGLFFARSSNHRNTTGTGIVMSAGDVFSGGRPAATLREVFFPHF